MDILFNARLDVSNYNTINSNEWEIEGTVVDNSGNFTALNSKVGDIIYIYDFMYNRVMRYKVTAIDPRTSGINLYVNVIWDGGSDDPLEPLVGFETIIGTSSGKLGFITMTSNTLNAVSESFMTAVKNYESFKILDTAISTDNVSPKKSYIALEAIQPYKLLYINSDDKVGIASADNVDCSDKIIGISLEAKAAGEQIQVQLGQKLQNSNWSFNETGKTLFLGLNGDFVTTPNATYKFIQEIGTVIGKDTIEINLEDAVLL